MRWIALLAVLSAALAVVLVARGDSGAHVRMLVAAALGVGLAILLGTGILMLAFIKPSSGDNGQATRFEEKE